MNSNLIRKITNTNNSEAGRKILTAARKMFLAKGYKAATVRDIAKEAGVNHGLVTYYYKTKSDLAQLVGRNITNELMEIIQEQTAELSLSNIEKMYIDVVLSWLYAVREPSYARLFMEFLLYSDQCDRMTQYFYDAQSRVLADYGLSITQEEKEIYWFVFKGSEKLLLGKKWLGEIDVTYSKILETMMKDYFMNLGIEKSEVGRVVDVCREHIENIMR